MKFKQVFNVRKCSCGLRITSKPGDYWDKNGMPENCPKCGKPFCSSGVKQETQVEDFQGSFGIGGIGIYQQNETPIIPSDETIRRYEEAVKNATVCKICGCSSLDGAMFTTIRGGDICDDCV
jgi:hypothetical protein